MVSNRNVMTVEWRNGLLPNTKKVTHQESKRQNYKVLRRKLEKNLHDFRFDDKLLEMAP